MAIKDTIPSQQQLIDAYNSLIHSQQDTYDKFIYILLGILAINVVFNFIQSRRRMRTELENLFTDEEPNLKKFINSEMEVKFDEFIRKNDKRIAGAEADIDRSFYFSYVKEEKYNLVFVWALRGAIHFHQAGRQSFSNYSGKLALSSLEKVVKKDGQKKYMK